LLLVIYVLSLQVFSCALYAFDSSFVFLFSFKNKNKFVVGTSRWLINMIHAQIMFNLTI